MMFDNRIQFRSLCVGTPESIARSYEDTIINKQFRENIYTLLDTIHNAQMGDLPTLSRKTYMYTSNTYSRSFRRLKSLSPLNEVK